MGGNHRLIAVYLFNYIHVFPDVSSSETGPRAVVNQLRLKLVESSLSTVKNCTELIDISSVQFFVILQPVKTSPGTSLVKSAQKTRLDWNSKH